MSEKNKITSLEEAKLNFEQIKKFAEEQATEHLKEHVAEKLKQIFEEKLQEVVTINISGDNIDIEKDGETVASVVDKPKTNKEEMGLSLDKPEHDDSEELSVSDDEDEISLEEIDEITQNENMEEMNMKMEDAAANPAVTGAPTPNIITTAPGDVNPNAASPAPTEEATLPDLLSKMDTLINILMQKEGGTNPAEADNGAIAGTDKDFEVIDDEQGGQPTTPVAAGAPVQEEIEITDFDGGKEKNFIDEMENEMLEIVDEEGSTVKETRTLGFTSKNTGNRNLKHTEMKDEKGHHAPVTALRESGKNKAQHESKIDELIKENNGLKLKVKELQKKEKEFEEAFVSLREQFDGMQLFNGKMALVNRVLMNGGLTQDEKIKVCEQFDQASTFEEANKLFKNIIKENNIKVTDGKEKLKAASTNTAKPKSTTEPLYESAEARRAKVLAGMIKTEDGE